ncbi:diguanylate cyclase [Pseudoalteromonas sp. C2R02]|uniref:ligand-binding sensor domain-containing protein n=1 Tax=Pseudoalteromonas sp. C2R02 TaxID=2841565 RepID=UPI001C0846CA|nr:ligand-binding sensor domain-containing diguanylate cyclase [Pseudoalteromonas sp. C2R02]MBU2972128.1 diguanylate cyclase [Pseudoalteromonas sp. C2R02]
MFKHIADDHKIPDGIIVKMSQDSKGFIWIATQNGLVRYDGYSFKTYRNDLKNENSLCGNFISAIWIDNKDKIWLGTINGNLCTYEAISNKFTRIGKTAGFEKHISGHRIDDINGNNKGQIWLASANGLHEINVHSKTIEIKEKSNTALSDMRIHNVALSPLGQLWVGTGKGLRYRDNNNQFNTIKGVLKNKTDISDIAVIKILFIKDKVWVGTQLHGYFILHKVNDSYELFEADVSDVNERKSTVVDIIYEPIEDEIWLSTKGDGLWVVDQVSGILKTKLYHDPKKNSSISHNQLSSMLIDSSGVVWIGSWGKGLDLYNPKNNAFKSLSKINDTYLDINSVGIISILQTQNGDIWLGTFGDGIRVISKKSQKVTKYQLKNHQVHGLFDGTIMSLVQTKNGDIWAGSQKNGLFKFDAKSSTFKQYADLNGKNINGLVYKMLALHSGDLLIVERGGVRKLNLKTNQFDDFIYLDENNKHLKQLVYALIETNDNVIIMGSYNHLYILKEKEKKVSKYNVLDGLTSADILGLAQTANGKVLIGNFTGLDELTDWNSEPKFSALMHTGVPQGNLIEDAQGRIWNDVSIINTMTNQVDLIDRADGIDIGSAWLGSYTKLYDGTILIGGSDGLLIISPEDFKPWSYNPKVAITNLKVDGNVGYLNNENELHLAAHTSRFSVEFSAFDYSEPDNILYAYKLEGYDEKWTHITSEDRYATYTNLDPGKYKLLIKATNRKGTWSKYQASLSINQIPSWYQQMWFKLCVIGLILIMIYLRIYTLKIGATKLKREVNIATKELKENNTALKNALADLERLSNTDALTGAYNRHFMNQVFTDSSSDFNPSKNCSFLMLDVDFFKRINDQYGHDGGDKVLKELILLVKQLCDENDWIVRWGGEEFVVVLNDTPREDALQKAQMMNDKIAEHQFRISKQHIVHCTCSIGVVSYPFSLTEPDAISWQETLNLADLALYQVKKHGRNHSCEIKTENETDIKEKYLSLINNQPTTEENTFFTMRFTQKHNHKVIEGI